jgi:TPR repeat protein
MSACINRWVLLAALAGHAATTWPLAAHAESNAPYALADALMPYAQRDYVRALELLIPLAEQGNAVAQLKLGIIFSRGKVNSPDHVAALRWFTKAAENGQVEAQFELGRIYRDGLGTRVDGKLAVYWLERAAEKNTPHAINALGELYLGHRDVPQDFAVARSWFLRGAQIGNSASMYNLGVLYARGQGVVRDDIEAFKWLELAADMGIGEDRDKALRARTLLAERLTPVEVSWAEGRVEDWSRARAPISLCHHSSPAEARCAR